ncbi:uncharacterized protein B0H64DRAFT_420755 [Chaetomium fimeti]|uniref:Berberine/berberine-like domain-containing protein n=1 Tax=Chaetomium fimeti TaxID=1854472 RepID=A0AAE0H8Q7_9PEZI|nr:hypothetical protein B0H64DRAFT_420755 [Chaetomium fimeti]
MARSFALFALVSTAPVVSSRCFPGDACWPTADTWSAFNVSLGGKLIANMPIAAVCHNSTFTPHDAAACTLPTNNSCNPFLDASAPCTMGNYPVYSVNATGAEDYQKTLAFAQEHNIRFVIRNTAADYNGKSSGAGSLALWTHHLKAKEMLDAYEFALAHDHVVVGANVPDIGLVGGYTQGAGTGPLGSRFGLGADQVLEWEAVLASGDFVVASPSSAEHADLYWALCGGGGGTYAAVLSATVKAHPPLGLSTANLTFALPVAVESPDAFWEAVRAFLQYSPAIGDAGAEAVWYAQGTAFNLATVFAPGFDKKTLDALMRPFLKTLDGLGLPYAYASEQHPGFLEGFLAQLATNVSNLNIGGRLIPRSLVESDGAAPLAAAIRNITSSGAIFSGVTFNVSSHAPESGVGANPYWREAVFSAVFGTFFDWTDWEANRRSADTITDDLVPQLELLTPGGAAYLNEYDFQQPDWETTLYGANWGKLSEVKMKYDPRGVFYALGAVESERWVEQHDGRLCGKA